VGVEHLLPEVAAGRDLQAGGGQRVGLVDQRLGVLLGEVAGALLQLQGDVPGRLPQPPLGYMPRQARGLEARQRVYAAALDRFAAEGVDDARVQDIVQAAGTSWGTFFRYFPRKQDVLLEAAVQHFATHVAPGVAAGLAADGVPARDTALELFRSVLTPVAHPPSLHGEIIREVVDRRERFAQMSVHQGPPLLSLLIEIVAHGQRRAEVRTDVPALTLAAVLSAGVVFTVLLGYFEPLRRLGDAVALPDVAELIDAAFSVAWQGVQPR
jgi:AcrR family transcriptional regulator